MNLVGQIVCIPTSRQRNQTCSLGLQPPCQFEDLHFHALAAEKALQLTYPLLETADLRAADHRFIRSHRCRAYTPRCRD